MKEDNSCKVGKSNEKKKVCSTNEKKGINSDTLSNLPYLHNGIEKAYGNIGKELIYLLLDQLKSKGFINRNSHQQEFQVLYCF